MAKVVRTRGVWFIAFIAVLLLGLWASRGRSAEEGAARELPALLRALPENAVLAIALTDLDRFRKEIRQTALHDVWQDPNMKLWREQSWPKWKALFAKQLGVSAEEIDELIHGDALFILMMDAAPDQRRPRVRAAVLIRPTTNRKALEAFAEKLFARIGAEAPFRTWADDVLIIAENEAAAKRLAGNLKAEKPPLAGTRAFKELQARYNPRAFAHVWVDAGRIMNHVVAHASADQQDRLKSLLGAFGVGNLAAFYAGLAVHEKGFLSNAWLAFEGERAGLFALPGENAPSQALRLVPADVNNFVMIRHTGLENVLKIARSIVTVLPEGGEERWKSAMAELGKALGGIDPEADLPKMIGPELAVTVAGGLGANIQISLYVQSPEPDRLLTTIEKLLAQHQIQTASAVFQEASYKYVVALPVPLPLQVSYGRVGDFVVFSTQQAGVRNAIATLKGGASLGASAAYREAIAKTGEPGWTESYSLASKDLAGLYAMFSPVLLQVLNQRLEAGLTAADLPNIQVLLDHQTPAVSRGRRQPGALESQGYSSVGAGIDVTVVAALAGAAAPNFLEAQQRAKISRARTDMRSLATAVEAYFIDWNVYPPYAVGEGSMNAALAPDSPAAALPSLTRSLTTPVAYITSYPPDLHAPGRTDRGPTYLYWKVQPGEKDPAGKTYGEKAGIGWMMVCAGPDGDYDIAGNWDVYDPSFAQPSLRLYTGANAKGDAFTYDPTNGTVSNGDLWRVKQ